MTALFHGRFAIIPLALALASATASAEDYYVSAARGKGKDATKEKPAKDLGNLVARLKDGDVVHIAEGTYLSRDEAGSDSVPGVQLIGGYSDDFSTRDPWGAHRTIFAGTSAISGSTQYRLIVEAKNCPAEVKVDGIIFDNGPRNHYADEKNLLILRRADAQKGLNATPESGAIKLDLGVQCSAVVQNTVVLNTAPTGGAIQVKLGREGRASIRNNLVVNNTGEGIFVQSSWKPRDGKGLPAFTVENNTILFSWKHDPIATYGGNSLKMDQEVQLVASNNVFAFGDYGGVDNIKQAKGITLKNNLFVGHKLYDYREFNTSVKVAEFEDEADQLKDSGANVSKAMKFPVGERFAKLYADRPEISRAEVDAKAKVSTSGANAIRSMLGLPVQAGDVTLDANVFLPRIQLDEALPVGLAPYDGFGCKKP
ncbi:MAG: right-handed parallel beta-helix repeat-containing protein [Myxococcaceae bacterium]|nr:right-handed parallel beta-helix repeat-containing protein [Myxococcaceae bacterium]MCA3013643.1 right-handed parallel beta-helix repeat-containing protein [Myxococcaceae bacterium]